jgi:DNA mismatch endonuclease, patch repair protein
MNRSENMRAIRSKDMLPELQVRRIVHGMGYRYRLHGKNLAGKPDLVFAGRHKVIFVHGCFWHSHGCKKGHIPKSNAEYWVPKLRRNQDRDQNNLAALVADGWKLLVIWECETKDPRLVSSRIQSFLGKRNRNAKRSHSTPVSV